MFINLLSSYISFTISSLVSFSSFFFFNDTATTEIYTLSLHDALPICGGLRPDYERGPRFPGQARGAALSRRVDRKSTRLNSSHLVISYAVFCLKKKKKIQQRCTRNLIIMNERYKCRSENRAMRCV